LEVEAFLTVAHIDPTIPIQPFWEFLAEAADFFMTAGLNNSQFF